MTISDPAPSASAFSPSPAPPPLPVIHWDYDLYCALPDDGRRWEVWEGDLVAMSPAPYVLHQVLLGGLYLPIATFLAARPIAKALLAPVDVIFKPDVVLQPDLVVVRAERAAILTARACEGPPDLVVEILSSDEKRDREGKRRLYAKYGVGEYWIVSPRARTVEVLRQPERGYVTWRTFAERERLTTLTLPGLEVDLAAVFGA